MANEIHIVRTKFETLDEDGNVVGVMFGARVYDDFGSTYVNHLETCSDLVALDRLALIDHVRAHSDVASEMLSQIGDKYTCLFVDGELAAVS
jgi:hypothetical protein